MVVYRIFFRFFKNFTFPTSGRYLQTSALSSGMQVEATEMDLSKIDEGSVDIDHSMQFEP